ncbi:reverse transcriptase domain-containing protein, partial [Glycomyces sp. L485]|nr:reverse transcriptase domain-containing protein [Glycomyces sp. L485]
MSGSQSEVKQSKLFDVSKSEVWMAWEQVLSNKGAAGVDAVELSEFADRLQDNLYRVWNRMASGSYHPAPVRQVEIPKPDGGVRVLGVPTVADRVAQTVAAKRLEAVCEPMFAEDSFGFRPGRSAHDAVRVGRDRCWQRHWVVDLDIARFFGSVDWTLLLKAVEALDVPAWVSTRLLAPGRPARTTGSTARSSRSTPTATAHRIHRPIRFPRRMGHRVVRAGHAPPTRVEADVEGRVRRRRLRRP